MTSGFVGGVPLMARVCTRTVRRTLTTSVRRAVPALMREPLNAGLPHEDVNTVAVLRPERYTLVSSPQQRRAGTGVKARKGHWITMSLPLDKPFFLTAVLRC